MSDTVIRVDNLSKRYKLGELHKHPDSFREKVTQTFTRMVRKARINTSHPTTGSSDTLNSFNSLNPEAPDHIWALRNVSFEVKRGEIVGVIGRNGAGKTTLLKILSRITKPTEGTALINGRVGSLLEVGTGFHQELTGRENIYLNGAILGMTREEIKGKLNEIVDFSGVGKFEGYPNRDSTHYVEMYGIQEVRTLFRGTLRNIGHCAAWYPWVKLGLFETERRSDVEGMTHLEFMKDLLGSTDDPKAAILILSNGRIVCTGTKTVNDATNAIKKVVTKIKKIGFEIQKDYNVEVENVIVSFDFKKEMHLSSIANGLLPQHVDYHPKEFPGLIYRLDDICAVLILFSSGKLVCTGAKSVEDATSAVETMKEKLSSLGVL